MTAKAREIAAEVDARPPPLPAGRDARRHGVPRLARRQPLHVPRLPLPRPRHGRRAGRAADRRRGRASASCAGPRPRTSPRASPRCRRRCGRTRAGPSSSSSPSRPRARPSIGRAISTTSRSSASTRRARSCGEHRFLGLFTSTAYSAESDGDSAAAAQDRPTCPARAHLPPGGHAEKALRQHPRDLSARRAVPDRRGRPAAHRDGHPASGRAAALPPVRAPRPFERFITCLIYAPRENYTTELRQKWQAILMEAFNGSSSEFNVHLSESKLARIMITVRTTPGRMPAFDVRELEARACSRRAALGRRSQAGADRRARRGARQRALRAVRRRLSRGVPRGLRRRAPRCPTSQLMERLTDVEPLAHVALPAARGGAGRAALQAVPRAARR